MNGGKYSSVVCAALAAGLLVSPAAAAGQGTETPSATARGAPAILSGQLVDAAGNGARSHGPLTMYAWPSNKALDALLVGETVPLVPVGEASTDAAGNFSFTGTGALAAHTASGEPVNVTIVGATAAGVHRYATSIDPATLRGGPTPAAADPEVGLTIKPSPTPTVPSPAAPSVAASSPAAWPEGAGGFCGATLSATYREVPSQVGGTFVHSKGATSSFRFTSGATGTFGVGMSGEGRFGTYAAGGTSTLTSDFSINFPTTTQGARFHQAYVVPKKLRTTCLTPDGVPYTSWYEVRATSYAGGGSTVKGSTFKTLKYCTKLEKGHVWEKNTTTAITWSAGLQTGRVIGVNLSSRSGFSNESRLIVNPGSKDRRICGHHALPGTTEGLGPRSIKVVNP